MDEMKVEEFNRRLALLDEQERDHLKLLITKLVYCYTSEHMEGVLVTGDTKSASASVLAINCDEIGASGLLAVAATFFDFLNDEDAPPKEMFN